MSDTGLQHFTQAVAQLLTTHVFPLVVQGLATDGHVTSVEKLLSYTALPVNRAALPAMGFGGAVPMTAMQPTVGKGRGRTTTTTTIGAVAAKVPTPIEFDQNGVEITAKGKPFVLGVTCAYRLERATVNKDKYCGGKTVNGTHYCNLPAHKDGGSPSAKKKTGTKPGVAPNVATFQHQQPLQQEQAQNLEFEVVPYDVERGLYRDQVRNFIVTELPNDGGVIVFGKLLDNDIIPLTEEEKAVAKQIGLSISENQEMPKAVPVAQSVAQPVVQAVTQGQIPLTQPVIQQLPSGQPTVQQLPQSNIPQIPTMSQPVIQQQIPTMAQPVVQPQMSIPQIPTMTQPQMGGIPQIPMMGQPLTQPQMGGIPQIPTVGQPMAVQQLAGGIPQIPMAQQPVYAGTPQIPIFQ